MDNPTTKAPFISESRKRELFLFQQTNCLEFHDINILNNAFIHSSYANEFRPKTTIADNERLEFLGDSILSVVVSEWLYKHLLVDEGRYSVIRSMVVNEDSLSHIAQDMQLDKLLLLGKGEEQTGGREKKAILADCMEALIAAIFLDQGYFVARSFVQSKIVPAINAVLESNSSQDYKTTLQMYIQKRYKTVPVYTLVNSVGPVHDQTFYYTVTCHNQTFGPASGHNKKAAEQNAARLALTSLGLLNK